MNSPAMNTTVPKGIVLNIQHFSIHDGPGMRTTVFLKGCSLRCKWCSNPESIHPKPELAYNPSKCIGKDQCGFCLKECPESAIFSARFRHPSADQLGSLHELRQVRAGLSAAGALSLRPGDDRG